MRKSEKNKIYECGIKKGREHRRGGERETGR
jgi:hypothetical protein